MGEGYPAKPTEEVVISKGEYFKGISGIRLLLVTLQRKYRCVYRWPVFSMVAKERKEQNPEAVTGSKEGFLWWEISEYVYRQKKEAEDGEIKNVVDRM